MGIFSFWHWIIVLIVILIIFGGRGKISSIMGDIGRGFRSLKNEMNKNDLKKPTHYPPYPQQHSKKFNKNYKNQLNQHQNNHPVSINPLPFVGNKNPSKNKNFNHSSKSQPHNFQSKRPINANSNKKGR